LYELLNESFKTSGGNPWASCPKKVQKVAISLDLSRASRRYQTRHDSSGSEVKLSYFIFLKNFLRKNNMKKLFYYLRVKTRKY